MLNQDLRPKQLSALYDHLGQIKSIEIERIKKDLEEHEIIALDGIMSSIIDSFYHRIVKKINSEENHSTRSRYLQCLGTIFRSR